MPRLIALAPPLAQAQHDDNPAPDDDISEDEEAEPATSPDDPRVAEAVRIVLNAPSLSIPQCMRSAGFSRADSASAKKQMWIRRRAPAKKILKVAEAAEQKISGGGKRKRRNPYKREEGSWRRRWQQQRQQQQQQLPPVQGAQNDDRETSSRLESDSTAAASEHGAATASDAEDDAGPGPKGATAGDVEDDAGPGPSGSGPDNDPPNDDDDGESESESENAKTGEGGNADARKRRRHRGFDVLPSECVLLAAPWVRVAASDTTLRNLAKKPDGAALVDARVADLDARERLASSREGAERARAELARARDALAEAEERAARAEERLAADEAAAREAEEAALRAELGAVDGGRLGRWTEMYRRLVEYKNENGHCRVKSGEDKKLNQWLRQQRDAYRSYIEGNRTTTHPYRMVALERLGVFVKKGKWEEKFEELRRFKERFGHCNVPQHWKENRKLGTWVYYNRHQYKWLNEGKANSMTEDRKEMLESLGFVWKVLYRKNESKNSATSSADCASEHSDVEITS